MSSCCRVRDTPRVSPEIKSEICEMFGSSQIYPKFLLEIMFMMTCTLLLQGIAQEILSDLVEDACLGLCFEVHRAVKQGYFFLDDTDQESMKDFGSG